MRAGALRDFAAALRAGARLAFFLRVALAALAGLPRRRAAALPAFLFLLGALDLRAVSASKRDAWFRAYLADMGVQDGDLPAPIAEIAFPADDTWAGTLPRAADLPTRRWSFYQTVC